ncbi:hypothetical protein ACSFBM_20900 [Variovorax sp. GB1R11]|uniref:hypothetical protein n=1 Tax=Variovorax sp. GB1R11 TaxID=3443741 RepID=UPI003F4515B7
MEKTDCTNQNPDSPPVKSWLSLQAMVITGLLVTGAGDARPQPAQPSGIESQREKPAIEYASVAEAMRTLKAQPGASVTLTKPDGWIIIKEASPTFIQWSFTPVGHYAYPAVVRRGIRVADNGDASIETTALCEAP